MMVTAVLAFTLAAASALPVEVQGESSCPTPSEVAAILPELLPASEASHPDIAWIEAAGLGLQIELRSLDGQVLFSRTLTSSGTCADLATIAAVVIASWTAERNPGLSLLQPGVRAPAAAAPAPSALAAPTRSQAPTPPGKTREFDLSVGLGSSVNSDGFVGAARVEAGLRRRRLGLRAGFAAETARTKRIEPGNVSWRRYGLSLGPTLAVVQQPVTLDARAEIFAGLTTVAGNNFDVNHQSSAVAPGLAGALRLGAATRWIRPWIEAGAQYWLADQEITIGGQPDPRHLPHWEGRLFVGISAVLSR